jgi:hypothetical protein
MKIIVVKLSSVAERIRRANYMGNKDFKARHNYSCYSGHKFYTSWEDSVILRGIESQSKIAKFLGRSLMSVSRRLYRLRVMNLEGPLEPNHKLPDDVYVERRRKRNFEVHSSPEFKLKKKEYDRKRYQEKSICG